MKRAALFSHWLEIETSYALSKFPSASQYPYLEAGVDTGNFSFGVSARTYLRRAVMTEMVRRPGDTETGLKLVQCLGKSLHNLVALDSTAKADQANRTTQIAEAIDDFSLLAEAVELTPRPTLESLRNREVQRKEVFSKMQLAQEGLDWPTFYALSWAEMVAASNDFYSAAIQYGWPQPGLSSGYVKAWSLD